ncbi:UDP-N-acetylmuramate--L-alanine ligase [Actinopolyspora halophila]|uniref:UDP-N-acetylmuramate--L-alanine ligase n=1 Tax=Actinopolyspora halophila TaxID=1850 RepID=UPI00036AF0DF|nr:UDP-N-acetylmuramate--L-alanine ligase [Actinopolyspora halophila]
MSGDAAGGRSSAEEALAPRTDELLSHLHLVGIGGAGMSGIARILLARGERVSGSDARDSRTVLALRTQGARVGIGHHEDNLDQYTDPPSAVVVSTAIDAENPELVGARDRGIPVLGRAEALAALMRDHRVACVTGTHGKTSTTSMLTVALQHCRLDPSFAIGGDLNDSGANAHHGDGGVFVAEADESDGSFLVFSPEIAVVTNVEPDHLDHHGTIEAYTEVFERFVERVEPGGVLIAGVDDPGAAALADRAENAGFRVRRYGSTVVGDDDARLVEYHPRHGRSLVELRLGEGGVTRSVELFVSVPGEHMAGNAVAALLAGLELGAPLDGLLEGLAAFGGVRRRFEFKGRADGVRVYDDYAHHPTEVRVQLRAARTEVDSGRLVVVFQPHLFSRTAAFAEEFAEALALADEVVVLDVYGAREQPQPGVSGELISEAVPLPLERVHYEPSMTEVPLRIAELVRPGDVVLTMGAGDVTMLGPEILTEVGNRSTTRSEPSDTEPS